MDESKRVAIVTGGGSGLGRSICEHLARDHRVGVLDLDGDAAEQVAGELRSAGAEAVSAAVDVSDQSAIADSFAKVRAELGPLGVLVTSAGIGGFTPFEKITLAEWERYLAVNLTGTFLSVQAALPDMVERRWGRIVTISSAAGQVGALRQGHYSASKGGVIAMTKTVALEYARKGITANTLPPFTADTPMLRAAQEAKHVPGAEMMSRIIPAGRVGTGDEIAAVCAFLCSDAASYITGQVVAVNGGAVV
ncbi:SDR family NAD(P)-dependent oxidoreductase [Nocardia aurantia]|uniref:3-oxoacyl-[acyl-carrier-protein] reductase MabA n=1 Tax=Nocardia aurantia TaxID=2585199 RepID=A0A7K0DNM9_9NOCA|nr:SDR family NAD(P)-dependent oxidoreductase [Nocardia aurantia]MQY27329.1 3-oxoacyl-[acyl-carrier-protein] reductase FabG [Nocardia aurantia]